jgi:hypothetical protein
MMVTMAEMRVMRESWGRVLMVIVMVMVMRGRREI